MTYLENFRLVVFRAVAEHLSFRKAAEELYLTQPAVSQQIKALEEDLGVLLFDRSGTQARLTPTGAVLVKYARLSNELLVEAEHEVSALAGTHAGLLSLGLRRPSRNMFCPGFWAIFVSSTRASIRRSSAAIRSR